MRGNMTIKNIFIHLLILIVISILFSCNKSDDKELTQKALLEKEIELLKKENELLKKEQNSKTNQNELAFLSNLNGKYPFDVNLLDNTMFTKRIRAVVGSKYDSMGSVWDVQTPIEIKNGMFYTWAMKAHQGGDPSIVVMVDINKNLMFVGLKEVGLDKVIYSEDGSEPPKRLKDWANEKMD